MSDTKIKVLILVVLVLIQDQDQDDKTDIKTLTHCNLGLNTRCLPSEGLTLPLTAMQQ